MVLEILKTVGRGIFSVEMELLFPVVVVGVALWGARLNWRAKPRKEKIVEYVGFWRRVAIKLIDSTLNLLIVPIAFNLFLYCRDGQTIGDKIFHTKIIDKSTKKTASAGQLVFRALAKILSVAGLFVGYWMAGWRTEKLAWHDGLSDTRYISTRKVSGWWTLGTVVALVAGLGGLLPLVIRWVGMISL